MKFKIGDKVRIRKDLIVCSFYGGISFVEGMKECMGNTYKILDIHGNIIYLKGTKFMWTTEMLEEVNKGFSDDDIDFAKLVVEECLKEKELREKNKMEKTFREVIADIKEGEVWENDYKTIKCNSDGIQIFHKQRSRLTPSMIMFDKDKFKLQRKEYTFEEAFKAYEEGKEIQSCLGDRFVKDRNTIILADKCGNIKNHFSEDDEIFSVYEIRNEWYIN